MVVEVVEDLLRSFINVPAAEKPSPLAIIKAPDKHPKGMELGSARSYQSYIGAFFAKPTAHPIPAALRAIIYVEIPSKLLEHLQTLQNWPSLLVALCHQTNDILIQELLNVTVHI